MNIQLILSVFLMYAPVVVAQETGIYGFVYDGETGEPLTGATIQNDITGTTTNAKGFFSITVDNRSESLIISYVGYRPDTMVPGQRDTLRIDLFPSRSLLNTAVITASRYEQSPEESVVSLEVLSSSEIEERHVYSLEDGLNQLPGVSIVGGQPNIRGGSGFAYGAGSRVMLLIDGIPALQADAGTPNWDDIPVENIEQVEVVKGAGSALYGSAALNGVIHVRTKYAAKKPQTEGYTFYRCFMSPRDERKKWWNEIRDGYGFSLAHRRKIGPLDLSGSVFYTDEESPNEHTYKQFVRSNLSLRYRAGDRLILSLGGNINTGKSGNFLYWKGAKSEAYLADTSTLVESERTRFYLDPKISLQTNNGGVHQLKSRWHHVDNNVSNARSNSSDLLYSEYAFQRTFKPSNLTVQAGAVYRYARGTAPLYGDTTFRIHTHALFAQLDRQWFDQRLTTSLGFRYETNIIRSPRYLQSINLGSERFEESKPVLRSGVNFELFPNTHLRASYGEGYRFPTLAEKFITTDLGPVFISPNPALESEEGWSTEIGIRQGLKVGAVQAHIDGALFWQEYRDMMEFVFTGDQKGFQARNIGDTRIRGLEGGLRFRATWGNHGLDGQFGYTYIDPEYKHFTEDIRLRSSSDENILKYRSKHRIKSQVRYTSKRLECGLNYRYASHQEAIDAVFELFIPGVREYRMQHDDGHRIIDGWVAYRIGTWKISLKVNNLFNEEYSIRPGLLEDPRNLSIRLIYADL